MKVKTFSLERLKLSASVPPRVRVNTSSSTSDTETVVTAVWFSWTLIMDAISMDGSSLTASIVTVTSALDVLSPWVMVYEKESLPL